MTPGFGLASISDDTNRGRSFHRAVCARTGKNVPVFRCGARGGPEREQEQRAGEAFLARIEQLVDQVGLDADVARQHVRDEAVGEIVLLVQDAHHRRPLVCLAAFESGMGLDTQVPDEPIGVPFRGDGGIKTVKYCPEFPERFGSLGDGRAFGQVFFTWYNHEHCHSGLGFLTPAVVHYGFVEGVHEHRQHVLAAAYAAHPERFVNETPQPASLPQAVWINPPPKNTTAPDAPRSPTRTA